MHDSVRGSVHQLTPLRVSWSCTNSCSHPCVHAYKSGTLDQSSNTKCRLCGKGQENLVHLMLAGCSALAQSKYLERHHAAFKVLFFKMCKVYNLVEKVAPWYSRIEPKPMYESLDTQAFWDVLVCADHTFVGANRVDARFVNHGIKQVV